MRCPGKFLFNRIASEYVLPAVPVTCDFLVCVGVAWGTGFAQHHPFLSID